MLKRRRDAKNSDLVFQLDKTNLRNFEDQKKSNVKSDSKASLDSKGNKERRGNQSGASDDMENIFVNSQVETETEIQNLLVENGVIDLLALRKIAFKRGGYQTNAVGDLYGLVCSC